MSQNKTRFGKRWTVNECLQLQREFELLNLSVAEIADRHQRTPNAIMFKLDQEGLANYNVLYKYHVLNSQIPTQRTNKYEAKAEVDEDQENDVSDEEEDQQDDQENDVSDVSDVSDEDNDNLKTHVMRLEKQVMTLTEMFMKSSKNKPIFSLFA